MNSFTLLLCVLAVAMASGKSVEKRSALVDTKLKWQLLGKNVCFHARSDHPGDFPVFHKGFLVAVKLVHRSGQIKCTRSSYHGSNFGCEDHTKLNILITDDKREVIFPPTHQIKRGSYQEYSYPGFKSTDEEIIFSDFVYPTYISSMKFLKVWNGEDWGNSYEGDNSGKVCVDVYGSFVDVF